MQHFEPKLQPPFPTSVDLTPLHTYTHLDPQAPLPICSFHKHMATHTKNLPDIHPEHPPFAYIGS